MRSYLIRASVILSVMSFSACGGGEGTESNVGSNQIEASQSRSAIDFSSGTWNVSMRFKTTDLNESGDSRDAVSREQQIIDFERGIFNNCSANFNDRIDLSDYPDDPILLAQEHESDIEKSFGDDFTTSFIQHDDTHITISSESESDTTSFVFDLKKVSDSLEFSAGLLAVEGDVLSEAVNAELNVCADRTQIQSFGPSDSETHYIFGAPYDDSRLVVMIRYSGMDLAPGQYDLTLEKDIEIRVSQIDLNDESVGVGSTTTLNSVSGARGIRSGVLTIVEASQERLIGSFEFETFSKGLVKASFRVSFPISDI